MSHPSAQALAAFALGKLPEAGMTAVAQHLEACSACRQVIDQLPPDSFMGKLRAARASVSSASSPPSRAGSMPGSLTSAAVAASLHRTQLREFLLPVAKDVSLDATQVTDFADREVALSRDRRQYQSCFSLVRRLAHLRQAHEVAVSYQAFGM